ncbi:MAG TPA: flagellar hook-basal body complex protein FliE [Gaiellaceae bacterium]|nr:flagellar hook-basal body complex protein FliE [Gaiellaceae bacterium]
MPAPVGPVGPLPPAPPAGGSAPAAPGGGFGRVLADSLGKLEQAQAEADRQTQALATGRAQDLSTVVLAVEKASLEVQLAAQVRNKLVDAYDELFRMQI